MIYRLVNDEIAYNNSLDTGRPFIYSSGSNIDDLRVHSIGYFKNVIYHNDYVGEWPYIELYYDSGKGSATEDYLLNTLGWPIVHNRAREVFEQHGIKDIKYVKVQLRDTLSGSLCNDYSLLFVNSIIEAYDMEKSKYKYIPKYNVYSFNPMEIVFNKGACSKYDIFRCSKNVAVIYVSERFRELVISNGLTGFGFEYGERNNV